MSGAGQLNRVRQVLIFATVFVCGAIAGYVVWFAVLLTLMASVSAYVGVIVPYAVALVIVVAALGFGVVQRKELGPRGWLFLVAFALPSILYSLAFSLYLLFGRVSDVAMIEPVAKVDYRCGATIHAGTLRLEVRNQ